ncbi:unnamed protein product [Amoebophrya sp. A25]|nr:unnamed protein product [Amoebophrya sp. A25]|eukprot:GSA25T00018768001.1
MPIIKEEKLTVFNPANFNQFKQEVAEGVYEDWKRDTVDSAKKRAIHQAPTYHAFEQLVAGCTLKPINKRDFHAPPKTLDHNKYSKASRVGDGSIGGGAAPEPTPLRSTRGGSSKAPKATSRSEFSTAWHRAGKSAEAKLQLLRKLGEEDANYLVLHQLDPDMFEELVGVLHSAVLNSGDSSDDSGTACSSERTVLPEGHWACTIQDEKSSTSKDKNHAEDESKKKNAQAEFRERNGAIEVGALSKRDFGAHLIQTLKYLSKTHIDFCIRFLPDDSLAEWRKTFPEL